MYYTNIIIIYSCLGMDYGLLDWTLDSKLTLSFFPCCLFQTLFLIDWPNPKYDHVMTLSDRSIPRAGIRLGRKTEHLAGSDGEGVLSDARNATIPFVSKRKRGRGTLKRRKSMRPMAGRKNKEGREKAIKDHREVCIVSERRFELIQQL